MNDSTQKGKALVVAIIALVVLTSILNIAFVSAIAPDQTNVRDGFRFAFTLVVCYFLYQGYGWARWVLGVLLALGGFIAIPAALILFSQSFLGALWLLIMGAVYLGCSWFLLRSPEVKAFMAQQRSQRQLG